VPRERMFNNIIYLPTLVECLELQYIGVDILIDSPAVITKLRFNKKNK